MFFDFWPRRPRLLYPPFWGFCRRGTLSPVDRARQGNMSRNKLPCLSSVYTKPVYDNYPVYTLSKNPVARQVTLS